jgi:hypothetical protein
MPLNGRSFWQLTQLTPGASYNPGGQNIPTNGTSIRASAVNVNVNGLPPVWTGWALDGANITESQLGGTAIQPLFRCLEWIGKSERLSEVPAKRRDVPRIVSRVF